MYTKWFSNKSNIIIQLQSLFSNINFCIAATLLVYFMLTSAELNSRLDRVQYMSTKSVNYINTVIDISILQRYFELGYYHYDTKNERNKGGRKIHQSFVSKVWKESKISNSKDTLLWINQWNKSISEMQDANERLALAQGLVLLHLPCQRKSLIKFNQRMTYISSLRTKRWQCCGCDTTRGQGARGST